PDKNCNEIMRRKLGFEKEQIIIGMVGRLSYQKGPDVFINSCKLVANEIPNCRFLIVGDGEDRQSIIQLAKKNGIADQLIITGWVENPLDYISTFDIACLFSRWEGFGLVLPEYMAMQKPIVATNVDAIPEIVQNKKNGLLVPVDNPIASAEAIIKLLKNERWRSVIVETARKEVLKEYDINRVAHEHQLLFEKVIKMP
ncbi:glycosyltransferase, partial [Faecalibaculum rodentium]